LAGEPEAMYCVLPPIIFQPPGVVQEVLSAGGCAPAGFWHNHLKFKVQGSRFKVKNQGLAFNFEP
jgi:hypothetical protein